MHQAPEVGSTVRYIVGACKGERDKYGVLQTATYLSATVSSVNEDGSLDLIIIADNTQIGSSLSGPNIGDWNYDPDHTIATLDSQYVNVVLASDPVAFWTLDGANGGIAEDLGSAHCDGVFNTIPDLVDGPGERNATNFDGVDDHVTFGPGVEMALNEVISLEAWVYLNDWGAYHAIGAYARANGIDMTWEWRTAQGTGVQELLRADSEGFDTATSNSSVPVAGWHHVAVTIAGTSASDVTFYLDGVPDGNPAVSLREGISTEDSVGKIGTRPSQDVWMSGSIAFAAIYDRVLTPEEILAHKTALVP